MLLSSKFLLESIGEKTENWSIFSEDMEKVPRLTFFGPPCIWNTSQKICNCFQ